MDTISVLQVDKEFEKIIPPLDEEEFKQLKNNILRDGEIYHPIIVWNGIIVDGHHRYKILQEYPELKYRIQEKAFANRHEAISWICLNQLGRRNLSVVQKIALMGRRYKAEKDSHGSQARFECDNSPTHQNDALEEDSHPTANKIAKEMGVSRPTVERAEKFVEGMDAAEEALPGISREILSGKIKPTQADVAAIAKAPFEHRKEMAEQLRVPRTLTVGQKAARLKRREQNHSIEHLYAEHIRTDKPKPTARDMISSLSADVDIALDNIQDYFDNYPDMLADEELKPKTLEVIDSIKQFILKTEKQING